MPETNQEERNIQRRLNQLDRKLPSTEPRYTVELTTEGWQIKDNVKGTIGASSFGNKNHAKNLASEMNRRESH